jgi:hypothetical protein
MKWLSNNKFSMTAVSAILDDDELIDTMGVYAIFLRDGYSMLNRCGATYAARSESDSDEQPLCAYIGESIGVLSRLSHHFHGGIELSGFRESLLALQLEYHCLWKSDDYSLNVMERNLTMWLAENALPAIRYCGYTQDVEAKILAGTWTPFNLKGTAKHEFKPVLRKARAKLKAYLKETGQTPRYRAAKGFDYLSGIKYQRAGAPLSRPANPFSS